MLSDLFTGPHLLIVLAVVILLFGATKLPALAKAVGQSARIFRSEVKGLKDDEKADATAKNDAPVVGAPVVAASVAAEPVQEPQQKP
jgi:sec-independent protein translocase protein TatA